MSAFITEWNVPIGNFTLPIRSGYIYDCVIDWGDGTPTTTLTSSSDPNKTHSYAVAGTYQISITGTFECLYINDNFTVKNKISKVIQWGDVGFRTFDYAFYGSAISSLPTGPITGVSNVYGALAMFRNCTNLTAIPDNFFDNLFPQNNRFQWIFWGCSNLEYVPQGLFRPHVNVDEFSRVFYDCSKLVLNKYIFYNEGEQTTRFKDKTVDFSYLFYNSSGSAATLGTAPDLWNCDFGTGIAENISTTFTGHDATTETNGAFIPIEWGGTWTARLVSATNSWVQAGSEKITVNTSVELDPVHETIKIYASTSQVGLESPENELTVLHTGGTQVYEATVFNLPDATTVYYSVLFFYDAAQLESEQWNAVHYWAQQKPTTVINIDNAANYRQFSNPDYFNYNHGFIFHNGYIYGSSRNTYAGPSTGYTGNCMLKMNVADYSDNTLFNVNVVGDLGADAYLGQLENIVFCGGYLWMTGENLKYEITALIRLDPTTLNSTVFNFPGVNFGQPVGTDGTYLFVSDNSKTYKIDPAALPTSNYTQSGSGYAYDIPQAAFLGNCNNIQHHPTETAYSHSIIADKDHVFVAFTTSVNFINGYDSGNNIYFYHLQKIRKSDMVTVNDVIIPKCTDDMVETGEWLFLALEYPVNEPGIWGGDWSVIAVNKRTMELRYLKALHSDFISTDTTDRWGYGLFNLGSKLVVQLAKSKKTVVIDKSDVENWDDDFPIGGATEGIFLFQIMGADIASTPNELVVDNSGNVHSTTWDSQTIVFKYSLSLITTGTKTPEIQTSLISSDSNSATIGGFVIDEGMSPITDVGFRYGTDPASLTTNVDVTPDSYDFQTVLSSLAPGIYYIQAWGVNTEGTWYGNTVIFSTYNALTLVNTNANALLEWLDENSGCSIRCVQDAPGVADGTTGTATDPDGNEYQTIVVNQKRWFMENLKTTKYRNGEAVPEVTDNTAWAALTDGGQCAYDNNPKNV